jgi:3-oxoacyl-[acyl-carrier-protein] synthase III
MLYLHAMGHFYPENIITNKFLEDLDIGTSNAWILERVGIENRRTILPLSYIKETKNANRMAAPEAALYNHTTLAAKDGARSGCPENRRYRHAHCRHIHTG